MNREEVEVGRQNLIAELREVKRRGRNNYGYYELYESTLADLIAVLEASKPTVVDREALTESLRPVIGLLVRATHPVSTAQRDRITDLNMGKAADAVLAALYPKATEGKS